MRFHFHRWERKLSSSSSLPVVLLLLLAFHLHPSAADIGTASFYDPPYMPTACYQNDPTQFPAGNMFAAAGDSIWDGGAACGRRYLINCLSPADNSAGGCKPGGQTLQVKIVDRASSSVSKPSSSGSTIVLSRLAFSSFTEASTTSINIDFIQSGNFASTQRKAAAP